MEGERKTHLTHTSRTLSSTQVMDQARERLALSCEGAKAGHASMTYFCIAWLDEDEKLMISLNRFIFGILETQQDNITSRIFF
jgi:hypothetical protein